MTLLQKEGLTPSVLGLLWFIKLNTSDGYHRDIIRKYVYEFETQSGKFPYETLEELGYIKYIKTGPKDLWCKVRLSKKGEEILKSLQEKPEHELTSECYNILLEQYKKYEIEKSKIVNPSKTKYYISEWLYNKEEEDKPYTLKMWKALIISYLNDFLYEKRKYVYKTNNLIFKADNVYATKFNKDSSPLYTYSNDNVEKIRKTYQKLYTS